MKIIKIAMALLVGLLFFCSDVYGVNIGISGERGGSFSPHLASNKDCRGSRS